MDRKIWILSIKMRYKNKQQTTESNAVVVDDKSGYGDKFQLLLKTIMGNSNWKPSIRFCSGLQMLQTTNNVLRWARWCSNNVNKYIWSSRRQQTIRKMDFGEMHKSYYDCGLSPSRSSCEININNGFMVTSK